MDIICKEEGPDEFTAYVDKLPERVFTAKTRQAAIKMAVDNYFYQLSQDLSLRDYYRASNQIHAVFMILDSLLGHNSVIRSSPRLSRRLDNLFNRLLSLNEAVREEGEKLANQPTEETD